MIHISVAIIILITTLLNLAAGSDERSDKFDSLLDGYLWPDSCYHKINCKKA